MRALLISNKNPLGGNDGGSLGILNVFKGYKSVGIDIKLLTLDPIKDNIPVEKINEQIKQTGIEAGIFPINTNINYTKLLLNLITSKLPYNLVRFYDEDFNKLIIEELESHQYDFIQLESSFAGLYVDTIRKLNPHIPIFLRAHNIEYEIWELNSQTANNLAKKLYFNIIARRLKKFEAKLFNKVDYILYITDAEREIIHSLAPNAKLQKLLFPIEINKYPFKNIAFNKLELATQSIAYIGALEWIPNQEGLKWFIKNVWVKLNHEFPYLKFYIAGKNPPNNLKKQLYSKNVVFLGEILDAKEYILKHPIFVVPLFAGSGIRVKIIEQMAMGRIIVSTSKGAEGIDIENGINGFIANTADEFQNLISRILNNEYDLDLISQNARKYIESTFDSRKIFEEFLLFLNSNKIKKNY